MHDIIQIAKTLVADPDQLMNWILAHGGLYLVMFIIFAETGLFVGFFLPGDSLLFVSGIAIANATSAVPFDSTMTNLLFWMAMFSVSGVLGNIVGYWFGNKSGHLLMKRPDSWLFKKKHLQQAHDFYEKKGGMAILLARFLPIVRTFAPIVGGMVDMEYKKFIRYNIIGCVAWVVSMTIAGYLLGEIPWVKHNLEKIVIGIIFFTTAPVLFKMFFGKKKPAAQG
ncbi:MAG: VTT domain-containing protein [Taibaiella sp.]|nr:VTT domain-containing protein [Taibaiella sp.]